MSLINQMLKDLEERGAQNTYAEIEIASNLSAAKTADAHPLFTKNVEFPLIKMGGAMILLAGAAYLWTQNTQAESRIDTRQKISNFVLKPPVNKTTAESVKVSETTLPTATADLEKNTIANQASPLFETELKFNIEEVQVEAVKTQAKQLEPQDTNASKTRLASTIKTEKQTPNKALSVSDPAEKPIQLALLEKPSTKPIIKPDIKPNMDSTSISKQIRPDQKSANLYKQALIYLQQGRVAEAQAMLVSALEASPINHEARQTLAGLQLDNKRHDEAKSTLADGVVIAPEFTDFRMALARLQVETGEVNASLNTLEQGLPYAKNNGNYLVFLATLMQRANRHEDAIAHYNTALSLNSASSSATSNALVGLGISLQAMDKLKESQEAFSRAQSSASLSPELLAFVEQRIKQIQQRLQN
jgi:MSHA biogenesis protein MshN